MKTLSEKEKRAIRKYWDNQIEADWAMTALVPYDEKEAIDAFVVDAMREEGMIIDTRPGVENLWGGERARRELQILLSRVNGYLLRYRDDIHRIVCLKFRYCRRIKEKEFESGVDLCAAIADGLIGASIGLPLPVTLISVYLVKHKILDDWCKCFETED